MEALNNDPWWIVKAKPPYDVVNESESPTNGCIYVSAKILTFKAFGHKLARNGSFSRCNIASTQAKK
jgi:hypothetical protein